MRRLLAIVLLAIGCDGAAPAVRTPATVAAPVDVAARLQAPADGPRGQPNAPASAGPRWGEAAGLKYLELMRGGAVAGDRVPMLVFIHGLGDRARPGLFEDFPTKARIVLPEAPTPYHNGFAWFPYRFRDNDPVKLAEGVAAAATQLADALRQIAEERPTVGKPIVTGFSQGGMLSYTLAVHHPDVLSIAIPLAGMMPKPIWPKNEVGPDQPAIRGAHGDADQVVGIDPARKLIAHLKTLNYDATLQEFPGLGHTVTPAVMDHVTEHVTGALLKQGAGAERRPSETERRSEVKDSERSE